MHTLFLLLLQVLSATFSCVGAVTKPLRHQGRPSSTDRIFKALDENHDGIVTRDEIQAIEGKPILRDELRRAVAQRSAARERSITLDEHGDMSDFDLASASHAPTSHALVRKDILASNGVPGSTCTKLTNQGSHFTVEVQIGTPIDDKPQQKFDVVADTGSNSLIIPSCGCQESGECSLKDRCFTGKGTSSSFFIDQTNIQQTTITFGSGPVQAVIASDVVRLGALTVNMSDGLLLMVRNQLRIAGPFEGILGLGLPDEQIKKAETKANNTITKAETAEKKSEQEEEAEEEEGDETSASVRQASAIPMEVDIQDLLKHLKNIKRAMGQQPGSMSRDGVMSHLERMLPASYTDEIREGIVSYLERTHEDDLVMGDPFLDWLKKVMGKAAGKGGAIPYGHKHKERNMPKFHSKGLLEAANVSTFSMCFNEASSGALNLNTFEGDALGSIGEFHWGLGLHGISVGGDTLPTGESALCSEKEDEEQDTPCGAIPDSGTTVMMAPTGHLTKLYETICDGWERCQKNYTAYLKAASAAHEAAVGQYGSDPFDLLVKKKAVTKASIFKYLLLDCNRWLHEENSSGLDDLPSVHFHVSGHGGKRKILQISGWGYVLEQKVRANSLEDALKPSGGSENTSEALEGYAGYWRSTNSLVEDDLDNEKTDDKKNADANEHGKWNDMSNADGKPNTVQNADEKQKPLLSVCTPAFSEMAYTTIRNGPVWILGTPLFYEYHVGYDIGSKPPGLSFTGIRGKQFPDGKECTQCSSSDVDGDSASLLSYAGATAARRVRRLDVPRRLPTNLDTTLPL